LKQIGVKYMNNRMDQSYQGYLANSLYDINAVKEVAHNLTVNDVNELEKTVGIFGCTKDISYSLAHIIKHEVIPRLEPDPMAEKRLRDAVDILLDIPKELDPQISTKQSRLTKRFVHKQGL